MNLTELSDLLSSATDVLRVETLDAYSSASDADYLALFRAGEPKPDPSEKQPWLDRLATGGERGHPWGRLRVVSRPVSEYVRYACEWGYVDNVAAGEDVRVLDSDQWSTAVRHLRDDGDLYIVDHRVFGMAYDETGAFRYAYEQQSGGRADQRDAARYFTTLATPFAEWWADNPGLHRQLAGA